MNKNMTATPPAQEMEQRPPRDNARAAGRRGAIVVLRAGALDYRNYPSRAGGELLPYTSGVSLGSD